MIEEFHILKPEIQNADKILESLKTKEHDHRKTCPESEIKILDITIQEGRAFMLIKSKTLSKLTL